MTVSVRIVILIASMLLVACAKQPPANVNDACDFLAERGSWYEAVNDAQNRWRIPKATILAFIRQESSFKADAQPKGKGLLGFIPWFSPSSAYGYSQALDTTWEEYKNDTNRWYARRSNFTDSADFIGWYNYLSVRELGLSPKDTYNLYLAYHEGRGGYKRKTYAQKKWLLQAAGRVRKNAQRYDSQIKQCSRRLKEPAWYDLTNFDW